MVARPNENTKGSFRVESHMAREENELFRKTEAVMTPQEAEELGATVETAKHVMSRNAPDERRYTRAD